MLLEPDPMSPINRIPAVEVTAMALFKEAIQRTFSFFNKIIDI